MHYLPKGNPQQSHHVPADGMIFGGLKKIPAHSIVRSSALE
jgi:hypothetical protein